MNESVAYGGSTLPHGIRSRFVPGINGLTMHVLDAGFNDDRPLVLLLHGFPELAYSWRKNILPLAAAGFRVIAPDQRGYGPTTGGHGGYDDNIGAHRVLNWVRDALWLVSALGYRSAACVAGHDFGAQVAACCALVRPDVFRSVVLMSAPFPGPPALPFNTANQPASVRADTMQNDLAALTPPRKHYQWYYSTPEADDDMRNCPQGVHNFLRAYFHHKSADWRHNRPFELESWTAEQLAKMPTYYIMERDKTMPETVAAEMPSAAQIAACAWLTDEELRVYSSEYERTGFQPPLQWYRCRTSGNYANELSTFAGLTIDVPSCFIAGASDWGPYQKPGDLEKMRNLACTRMSCFKLVDGAGHWVQQERPDDVNHVLLRFLQQHARPQGAR